RENQNAARLESPAVIYDAHAPPRSAPSVYPPTRPATARFSFRARDRYLRPRNQGVAPGARAKINPRFFRRARPLRPGPPDECVVLHAHRAEFLPDTFRFSSNQRVATKPVASNHVMLPPASP